MGAGSAGCALARGLSEDPGCTVLLIEAGPGANRFWVRTPAGIAKLFPHRTLNWNFRTEPMERLRDRPMYWPRGKLLGGSSAINGMVFIRGHRKDFDSWRDLGNPGWGYDDVLPFFKRMEHNERGADAYRGVEGPLWISDPVVKHPSSFDFIEAAARAGLERTGDLNGAQHDGVGFMQHSIRHGVRHSAFNAFVEPVLRRPNLSVWTNTAVRRVLFDGRRAVGVEIEQGGERGSVQALREVVLSAGSLKSPQLLMLSGVGPGAELQRFSIELVHNAPCVGRNLQDHFYVHTDFRATRNSSYNASLIGLRKYWQGARYVTSRNGYLALGSSQVAAFVKSSPEQDYADLQISFRPMTFTYHSSGVTAVKPMPGLGVSVYQLPPSAAGTVTLRSPDAADPAAFTPNFLTTDVDVQSMLSGIRTIRAIMATDPIRSRVVQEDLPGPNIHTDEQLLDYMERHGNSAHHQAGTCKMGCDALAVVDERLRVRGVERLRVVDASIMPHLTSGNTNAPTIMIGVKAADMMRQDATPRLSSIA